ncbi:MAG TPA: hypothetical protein VHA78_05050 [Candidatus Peribacteraceae bacterium]|nr:hypothetical protein [Candidatus Peribacteraceae bacterium]
MTANRFGRLCASVCALSIACSPFLNDAIAASGDTMTGSILNSSTTSIDAQSGNTTVIDQTSGSGATQHADASGSAVTNVNSNQVFATNTNVGVDQNCSAGTGKVCVQQGSPTITNIATQQVTASSSNLLVVSQTSASGSQTAALSGTSSTTVNAAQIVAPTVALAIAQNCASGVGACVQSAIPVVSTIAQQIINANSENDTGIRQTSGSGAVQNANINVNAQTNVAAAQVVTPTTVVSIAQKCSVSTGLCLQDLYPLLQTLAQQVVSAQAANNVVVDQSGGSVQNAAVTGSAATVVNTAQAIQPVSDINVSQVCDVSKGLCIQRQNNTQPTYIFTDGTTTESGSYNGNLDTHALDTGLTRIGVQTVAMGICPLGQGVCPEVQQLLFWLFGPEPSAPVASASASDSSTNTGNEASRRGHQTNVIGGIVHFLAATTDQPTGIATAGFGGTGKAPLDAQTKDLLCSVERSIAAESDTGTWQWTAQQIAGITGVDVSVIETAMHDSHLCNPPKPTVQVQKSDHAVIAFPIDDTGPVSHNALWNVCVRSNNIPYQIIKNNPDRDSRGLPRTCSDYHTENIWYQPDLGIYFYWDKDSKTLKLPDGYIAVKM